MASRRPAPIAISGDDDGVIGIAFKWNPRARAVRCRCGARPPRAAAPRGRPAPLHGLAHEPDLARRSSISRSISRRQCPKSPTRASRATPRWPGGSDLYVANRGDGSLLRIDQDGTCWRAPMIDVPGGGIVGADRIRAIAVSADAQRLWLTLQGELPGFPGHEGTLIEVSAFDAGRPFAARPDGRARGRHRIGAARRAGLRAVFTPENGLGPLFNARSCAACHPGPGGASTREEHFARRVARMDPVTGRVTRIDASEQPRRAAPLHARARRGRRPVSGVAAPGQRRLRCACRSHSSRSAAIDEIPDAVIEAQAVSKGDGIKGRVNYVTAPNGEQRVGRYGWKADIADARRDGRRRLRQRARHQQRRSATTRSRGAGGRRPPRARCRRLSCARLQAPLAGAP